jgi:hypothetical protein
MARRVIGIKFTFLDLLSFISTAPRTPFEIGQAFHWSDDVVDILLDIAYRAEYIYSFKRQFAPMIDKIYYELTIAGRNYLCYSTDIY